MLHLCKHPLKKRAQQGEITRSEYFERVRERIATIPELTDAMAAKDRLVHERFRGRPELEPPKSLSYNDVLNVYRRFAGEVEPRNVQSRLAMTPEERHASLASETEDMAREDQIVLERMLGSAASIREGGRSVPVRNRANIETELAQVLGAARTRKLTGQKNGRVTIVDSQEEARRIIAQAESGRKSARKSTSTAIAERYPDWMDNQVITTSDSKKGQQTQISGTSGTYGNLEKFKIGAHLRRYSWGKPVSYKNGIQLIGYFARFPYVKLGKWIQANWVWACRSWTPQAVWGWVQRNCANKALPLTTLNRIWDRPG